ncbi:hypothetical protein NLI96_g6411 [Meripilus lineatus]|uniref:Uncharacterized protein n=1 Tax=Meripilus lineatus TaxID=2056292 RepID=A0AAD5YDW6_9APHY|nr:hypothetical protein NLI96_g6411 [Physisporinus lineatus]
MSPNHPPLHRSNLRKDALFHFDFSYMPSLRHHCHYRFIKGTLRCHPSERSLRQSRWNPRRRTQHARERIPQDDRLAINGQYSLSPATIYSGFHTHSPPNKRKLNTKFPPPILSSTAGYVHLIHIQCTREVLQEYYVNLVRTHTKGIYVIVDSAYLSSSGASSSDSDMDYETGTSRPASPTPGPEQSPRPSPTQVQSPSNLPLIHSSASSSTTTVQNPHGSTSLLPNGRPREFAPYETSTILIDTTTLSPQPPRSPTVEQNMAFQAFQQSGGGSGGRGLE